jgi:hypothetical protein
MPEAKEESGIDGLLAERGREYGDAWLLTGEIVAFISEKRDGQALLGLIFDTQYLYPWITILCKIIRILQSPAKVDHWKDIAGYATLVAEHLERDSRGRHEGGG